MKTRSPQGYVFPSLRGPLLLLTLAASLLAAAPSASAVEAVPIVDSTLASSSTLGLNAVLRVNNDQNTLLQFWLASVPNGTNIEKATLRLWVSNVIPRGNNATASITVFSSGDNVSQLNERTLTKNNAPGTNDELGTIVVNKARKGNYILLDVTDYVRPLTANALTARPTFIIKQADGDPDTTLAFDSKENTGTSHGPILELVTAPMFAVVAANGTIARSSPGVTVNRTGAGSYEVFFPRDVTKDVYTGTIGGIDIESPVGLISVSRRSGNANGVFVLTRAFDNTNADLSFHLTVGGP